MLDKGSNIQVDGHTYRIVRPLGVGGEGETYEVAASNPGGVGSDAEECSGANSGGGASGGVLKRFHDHHDVGYCVRRTRYLMDRSLERECSLLTPPLVLIEPHGRRSWCGHLSRYRRGRLLEDLLMESEVNVLANLQLAVVLVHGLEVMHQLGLSHGDVHPRNVIVDREGGTDENLLLPHWIDLDNFNGKGIEPSRAWGALQYLAPEVRRAMADDKPYPPDIPADLFALTCLLHDVLFLRHVAAGNDQTPEAFERAMTCGRWLQDPARIEIDCEKLGGLSNRLVNANVAQLFRRGLSTDRDQRPTTAEWKHALLQALDEVYLCPGCGYPVLIDASKQRCPACQSHYPTLGLRLPCGASIALSSASRVVGRSELCSPYVSERHAVLRRIGPETWLESIGSNGSFRHVAKTGWVRLTESTPHLLEPGDAIRFADVATTVIKIAAHHA